MSVTQVLFQANLLPDIRAKEDRINELNEELSKQLYELQELKKLNASRVTIQWKESIKLCLDQATNDSSYFLKTPAYISNCVAWTNGVELTRDIKNKIATTLSVMFNQSEIGRIQHKGKTYYGQSKFFEDDLVTLKFKYKEWTEDLLQ